MSQVTSFIYQDNPLREFRFGRTDYYQLNASKYYLQHYSNLLLLQFIKSHPSATTLEKFRAYQEIRIAERKMEYWKRHPNWNQQLVEQGIHTLRQQWNLDAATSILEGARK